MTDMVSAKEVPFAWVPYLKHNIEKCLQNFMSRYPCFIRNIKEVYIVTFIQVYIVIFL